MKKIILCLLIFGVFISGCQKGNITSPKTSINLPEKIAPQLYSGFRITNTTPSGSDIMELQTLNFVNESDQAVSYYWDFGNGNFSTEKEPSDVFFAPCQRTVTITLTVKNKAGETASSSHSFFVQCSRMGQPHTAVPNQY